MVVKRGNGGPGSYQWALRGARGSREKPVDVKEKCSRTVVFYLAKSFTKRLEASEFHDSMMFLTSSMNFASVLIRSDHPENCRTSTVKYFEPSTVLSSYKTEK